MWISRKKLKQLLADKYDAGFGKGFEMSQALRSCKVYPDLEDLDPVAIILEAEDILKQEG